MPINRNGKKAQWYNIAESGTTARINLYGEIDQWEASWFIEDLNRLDVDTIDLHINSIGGSISAGINIFTNLAAHKAKVEVMVDGEASSIATYIAMAASIVRMASDGLWCVHKPMVSHLEYANADDLAGYIKDLELMETAVVGRYVGKTGKTEDEIKALMKEDRYMSASEAKEWGFVDEIVEPLKMVASATMKKFQNAGGGKRRANQQETEKEDKHMSLFKDKLVALAVIGRVASDEDASKQLDEFVNKAKKTEEALAKAETQLANAKKDLETEKERSKTLETEANEAKLAGFEAKIDAAINARKITKDQKEGLLEAHKSGPEAAEKLLNSFKVPVAPTRGAAPLNVKTTLADIDAGDELPEKNEDGTPNYTNMAVNRRNKASAEA